MRMRRIAIVLISHFVLSTIAVFPSYKQCDARWGDDKMGVVGSPDDQRDTICHQGCAMSSLAIALAGFNFTLQGGMKIDPGSLNAWLVANDGYRCLDGDCCNLVMDAPDVLTGGRMRFVGEWGGLCCGGDAAKPPLSDIKRNLSPDSDEESNVVFIAHVRNRTHFVLLVSWNETAQGFDVRDPGFDTPIYAYDDISDIIMYSVIPPDAYVPKQYPLFKQYDYRWANDTMVKKTVAEVGCLMSSTSMALNAFGVRDSESTAMNPGSLNAWLRSNGGYDADDDMIESSIPKLSPNRVSWSDRWGMHTSNDVSLETVASMLSRKQPVIANVMKGRHFVLVVGLVSNEPKNQSDATTLYVNDPGFYRNTYDYRADVVGWRLFNMSESPGQGKPDLSRSSHILRSKHANPLPRFAKKAT